jgi:itaconate CoA-transferase
MHEVWAHAQLHARKRQVEVQSPVGPIKALLPPGIPDDFAPRMDPIPAIGEHTESILQELGYSAAQIRQLRDQGAI